MSAVEPPAPTIWTVDGEALAALELAPPADPAAPALIILHGFPDHPPTWLPLGRTLAAAGHRVVVPWMRGYAPSTLRGPFTVERLRDDALAVIDRVSPTQPVALLGHDWGALVTYAVCQAAPERVRRAVALSVPTPLAFLRLLTDPRQLARSWYMGLFQLGLADRLARRRRFALIDQLWRRWSPRLRREPAQVAALHACLEASWPAPLAPYRAVLAPRLLRKQLGEARRMRIAVPTLQLHGAQDGCIAAASVASQRDAFTAEFEQQVVADAGHFLHLDAPARVAREVLRWLGDEATR
jgi:pimeloyl-ACP methyl ester carboxylesterase